MTQHSSHLYFIAAGGTGGHVIPGELLGEALVRQGHRVVFLTDHRARGYLKETSLFTVIELPLGGRSGNLWRKLKWLQQLLVSLWKTRALFRAYSPQAVIGFGGFPALPALFWSVLRKTPLVLHEQNAVLGRVNRWFGLWAQAIGISTRQVALVNERLQKKLFFTGLPVRSIQENGKGNLYKPPRDSGTSAIYVTVLGGSQAAQIFSDVVPQALALLPSDLQARLEVTQQCRAEALEATEKAYEALGIKKNLAPFFSNVLEILKKSHLVIARAGASTIGELTALNRPAILIPYPWATDDHQTANAKEIVQGGGGWLLAQGQFTPERLARHLLDLLPQPQTLLVAAERLNERQRDQEKGTEKLLQLVLGLNHRTLKTEPVMDPVE